MQGDGCAVALEDYCERGHWALVKNAQKFFTSGASLKNEGPRKFLRPSEKFLIEH